MDFRSCVIDSLADERLVRTFNLLHGLQLSPALAERLREDGGSAPLGTEQQEALATFRTFVHLHVWRRIDHQTVERAVGA